MRRPAKQMQNPLSRTSSASVLCKQDVQNVSPPLGLPGHPCPLDERLPCLLTTFSLFVLLTSGHALSQTKTDPTHWKEDLSNRKGC